MINAKPPPCPWGLSFLTREYPGNCGDVLEAVKNVSWIAAIPIFFSLMKLSNSELEFLIPLQLSWSMTGHGVKADGPGLV
jgi:hypothetical protein